MIYLVGFIELIAILFGLYQQYLLIFHTLTEFGIDFLFWLILLYSLISIGIMGYAMFLTLQDLIYTIKRREI